MIESKVSMVSQGLSHISTTVDPDWGGRLLIAVHNHSGEHVYLPYDEPFCTMVFLKNLSASKKGTTRSDGRNDILVKHFMSSTKKTKRKELLLSLVPPAIVGVFAFAGYLGFGNAAGFTATTAVGVAIAQYVGTSRLR